MESEVKQITVLLMVDGVGEASFYLNASQDGGTDVSVAINPAVRPNAVLGILLLSLDSAMVHTRNNGELAEHWQDFQPMVRDTLELNELIMAVTAEFERLEDEGKVH